MAGHAATAPPTIGNNISLTPVLVGQSQTRTVTLTLNAASAIKSIALATGTAGSQEYTLNGIFNCTVDGTTVNPVGTVCSLTIAYTPLYAGSAASPRLSRNAQLLYTDGSGNVTAYGLSGSASNAFGNVSPGTLTLYAGLPYTATGVSPLDNSLGSVTGGYAGTGGAATSATFDFAPYSAIYSQNLAANATQPMALDSQGNLYVIDLPNYVIRKIDNSAQHLVTTIAGTAKTQGYTGNNGPATSATLNNPHALTLDAAGNLYFIDSSTNNQYNGVAQVIRRIDAVTGVITAVYGQNFTTSTYDSADGGGTCNLSASFVPAVYACGDGGLATYAYLNGGYNLALDASGNFYLSGTSTPYIRKITASTGIITTIATTATLNSVVAYGGMTLASDGNLYLVVDDQTTNTIEIKQVNTSTFAVKVMSGTNVNVPTGNTNCYLAKEQGGIPATNFEITGGSSSPFNDLSADASGNVYISGNFCTQGVSNTGTPGIARLNIGSDTVFAEVVANAYPYGGTATTNYNAYTSYAIAPVTAIPDNAGNLYFTTYNQIAVLQGTAAAMDFGSQNDYVASGTKTATYANLGNMTSAAPTYSLASGASFILSETGDSNACDTLNYLGGGAVCNLDIAFDPIAVGALSDTLNVNPGLLYVSVDPNSGTQRAATIGTGALTVAVTGVGVAEPKFTISPPTLAFGTQAVKTTSAPLTFTLSNPGTGPLTINSVFPDGTNGFSNYATVPSQSTCSTTTYTILAAGTSCTVAVTFTPQTATSLPANFYVATSLAFGDVATLSGTGTNVVTGTPTATLAPSPVVFANTGVGNTLPVTSSTVMLSNTGTATLTAITPTITGTNANQFSIDASSTCGSTLAMGASCNLVIDFTPTIYGLLTATLSVSDNAASSPQTDKLAGIGIRGSAGQMQFYPSQMTLFAGQVPGTCSESGIPGPIASANFCTPSAVAVDPTGNTYIVDQQYNTVLKVDTSGNVTVFAGAPVNSYYGNAFSGDGGQAASAALSIPVDVAVDAAGNVYISDSGNGRIREVNALTGIITTFAGGGSSRYFVPGPATSVSLEPEGINFDLSGNLYVAYGNQNIVVKITPAGAATIFAGSEGTTGAGTPGYTGDNGPATSATLNGPNTVAADPQGNVYLFDYYNCVIRKVNSSGIITTFAGNGTCGLATNGPALQTQIISRGMAANLAGDLIVSDGVQVVDIQTTGTTNNVTIVGGGGSTAGTYPILATSASFPRGTYVARVDNNGNVLIPGQISTFGYQVVQVGPVGDLQFGSQTVNTPTSLGVTIENTGNGGLTLNGLNVATVTGPNASDFTITGSTCGYNLLPAATCVVTVTFTPSTTGLRSASLAVPAGSSTQTVILQGTGSSVSTPTATLTGISFGNQTTNTTSSAMSATLTNTGSATLTISNIAIAGNNPINFTVSTGTNACGTSLSAGASCSIYVTFSPTAVTSYNATLSVTDNATGSPTTSALSGTGTAPAAPGVTLSSIAFPNTPEGTTSAPVSATLTNTGNATLTISSTAIVGSNFTLASGGSCGSTLAAGASCSIPVTFSPVAPTSYSATLSVTDNATGSPHTSALTGTGTYVKPTVTLLPSPFVYASTTVGQKSAAQVFTLTNTGTSPFSFTTALTDTTDFAITTGTCGTVLTAGQACTITIVFQPQSPTTFPANLLLADYGDGLNAVASLSGTGVAVVAPVLTPAASLSPASLAFPNTTQGATATALSTTLSNTGTGPLTISGVALGGTNVADFTISNGCGLTLAAGSNCTISATFTPAGAATYTATITVTDNSAVTTQVATLTGTGLAVATDFSLTTNTPSQIVTGGNPAHYSVAVTPIGGSFNGVITFAVSGLPAGSVATFAPATLTPGGSAATTTLTVTTVPRTGRNTRPFPWLPSGLSTVAAAFLLPMMWRRHKLMLRGRVALIALALLLSGAALTLSGCGAGFTLPAANYTLTVTGTSGTTTHSTTVALTVQ